MIKISRRNWVKMGIIAERIKNFLKPQNLRKQMEIDIIQLKNVIYEIKSSRNEFTSRLDMKKAEDWYSERLLVFSAKENTKAC